MTTRTTADLLTAVILAGVRFAHDFTEAHRAPLGREITRSTPPRISYGITPQGLQRPALVVEVGDYFNGGAEVFASTNGGTIWVETFRPGNYGRPVESVKYTNDDPAAASAAGFEFARQVRQSRTDYIAAVESNQRPHT